MRNTLNSKIATDPTVNYGAGDLLAMCGNCNQAAHYHPIHWEFLDCNREASSIPFIGSDTEDYYLTESGAYVLPQDYSGSPANVERLLSRQGEYIGDTYYDEDAYVSVEVEANALDRWSDKTYVSATVTDKDSWIGTVTREQALAKPGVTEARIDRKGNLAPVTDNVLSDEVRNLYVEGNDGFTSRKLLDEVLTKKYHERLLNVYADRKTGQIRIGGIRIVKTVDGNIQAQCVQNGCNGTSLFPVKEMELLGAMDRRDAMETFVHQVIRHGNNHAAAWFTTRESFYKVHAENCDFAKCNETTPYCRHLTTTSKVDSVEDPVMFLMEHQRYCSDSNCTCSELLAELLPSLASA